MADHTRAVSGARQCRNNTLCRMCAAYRIRSVATRQRLVFGTGPSSLKKPPVGPSSVNVARSTMMRAPSVTVRVRVRDGAEGLGYTYSVHAGGAAIHAMVDRYFAPSARPGSRRDRTSLAEHVVAAALDCRCGGCSVATIRGCRSTPGASTSNKPGAATPKRSHHARAFPAPAWRCPPSPEPEITTFDGTVVI